MGNMLATSGGANKNKLVKGLKLLLGLYAFILVTRATTLWKIGGTYLDIIQGGIGLILLGFVFASFLSLDKDGKIDYVKSNAFIILYLVMRLVGLLVWGMDMSILKSIFLDGILLVGILGAAKFSQGGINLMLRIVTVYVFLINSGNALIVAYTKITDSDSLMLLMSHSDTMEIYKSDFAVLYGNSVNTMGIMTGLAVVSFLVLCRKGINMPSWAKVLYLLSQTAMVIESHCRAAEVGLVVVFAFEILWYVRKEAKNKELVAKACTTIVLCGCILAVIGVQGLIISNAEDGIVHFNETETGINLASSGRYYIWKSAYMAGQDSMVLGQGSQDKETANRDAYVENLLISRGVDADVYDLKGLYLHNGYFTLLYCTGILGFLAFVLMLLRMVRRHKGGEEVIIYGLVINLFESMLIASSLAVSAYLFAVLGEE